MKIDKIDIFAVSIPYRKPFRLSLGEVAVGDHVVVRVVTDDGVVGYGEAATILPERTGESQEAVVANLRRYVAPAIVGCEVAHVNDVLQRIDSLAMGRGGFLYAKAAVDHALYDAWGHTLGVSVGDLLGGRARTSLTVERAIGLAAPEAMAAECAELAAGGYQSATLKLGEDVRSDVRRVAAVRAAVGSDFELLVDPNQRYSAPEAITLLRRLEPYDIAGVEQPCPWWDFVGMSAVTAASVVPVVMDEGVHTPADAIRVVRERAADIVCVKLVKCGGLYLSQRVAAVATAAGLGTVIGSMHTFGPGTAAIQQFCSAVLEVDTPIGYGSPLDKFVDDLLEEDIVVTGGAVQVPAGPGLGVTVDEDKLRRYGSLVASIT